MTQAKPMTVSPGLLLKGASPGNCCKGRIQVRAAGGHLCLSVKQRSRNQNQELERNCRWTLCKNVHVALPEIHP